MAKAPKQKRKSAAKGSLPEIEIEPDAWERFEKLVKSAAKMGHQAHAPTKPSRAKSKAKKPAK